MPLIYPPSFDYDDFVWPPVQVFCYQGDGSTTCVLQSNTADSGLNSNSLNRLAEVWLSLRSPGSYCLPGLSESGPGLVGLQNNAPLAVNDSFWDNPDQIQTQCEFSKKAMATKQEDKSTDSTNDSPYMNRVYNSKAMKERRGRILSVTLDLIEEKGLNDVTIREVSKRSGVALRTLYLYFENREEMVSLAINEYFIESIAKFDQEEGPKTLPGVLERLDRMTSIVLARRAYATALAPIFFSQNIDIRIYEILRAIAISHVKEFLDKLTSSKANQLNDTEKNLLYSQIANIEFAVIDDALRGRLAEDQLNVSLKLAVLSLIQGFLPKPPAAIKKAITELRAMLE